MTQRVHPEGRKRQGSRESRHDPQECVPSRETHFAGIERANRLQRPDGVSAFQILRSREPELVEPDGGRAGLNEKELLWSVPGQRLEYDVVDDAEDRGNGASAESKGHRAIAVPPGDLRLLRNA